MNSEIAFTTLTAAFSHMLCILFTYMYVTRKFISFSLIYSKHSEYFVMKKNTKIWFCLSQLYISAINVIFLTFDIEIAAL